MRATGYKQCSLYSYRQPGAGGRAASRLRRDWHDAAGTDDVTFIEKLCADIADLPTIRASVATIPAVADYPIYAVHHHTPWLGNFHPVKGIGISMRLADGESLDHRFDVQKTTLPHELRHGYQELAGVMAVRRDPRFESRLGDLICHERMIEADATAFSIAVMYEYSILKGNARPLALARDAHPGPVDAYCDSARHKEDNHWNGRAAQVAYRAYFREPNAGRLDDYDRDVCRDFWRASFARERASLEPEDLDTAFFRHNRHLSAMPYLSRGGRIVQRPRYQPQSCRHVMTNISRETAKHIAKARAVFELRR